MSFFKENPKALLDAIPTPRGEEEKLLKEFKNGFAPKPEMNLRLNDTSSSGMNFKLKNNSFGGSSGLNTPSKRIQSPKVGTS